MRADRGRSRGADPPYRGEDRRGIAEASAAPLGGAFVMGGTVLLAAVTVFTLGPLFGQVADVVDPALIRVQLEAAAIAVAVLVGVLCYVRWRMTGEAAALYLSAGTLYYGLLTVGLGYLLNHAQLPELPALIDWVHPASRLAVMWLLVACLRTPVVDSGLRLWRLLGIALAVTAMLTVVLQFSPRLVTIIGSGADPLVQGIVDGLHPGALVLTFAWMGFGVAFTTRGVRRQRWLFAWFGLCFFALAFAELLRIPPHDTTSAWLLGPSSVRFIGLLLAGTGATRELLRAFGEQQSHLLESVKIGMTSEARLEAEKRALEERAHEARNALTAIEGATRTLEHYRDRLDEDTRTALSEAVTREIARLQQLVSADRILSGRGEFRLADIVAAMVTAARSHGVVIHVDIPEDLTAYGRPGETGQVIQNLIENARRYAPGSPIYLRAHSAREGTVLRVEDQGPGVAAAERGRIFERGTRGGLSDSASGSGLGLYVSAQLMREQGGELWVEERAGGGASFALWLPNGELSARLRHEVLDKGQDAVEASEGKTFRRSRRARDRDEGLADRYRQLDDDVRDHA